jgi:hypothetical protein
MVKDIYKDIDRYIAKLEESGFGEYASKIRDAKFGGAMASEILGLVSLELKKAREMIGEEQDFLVKSADSLLNDITKIFKTR